METLEMFHLTSGNDTMRRTKCFVWHERFKKDRTSRSMHSANWVIPPKGLTTVLVHHCYYIIIHLIPQFNEPHYNGFRN